MTWTPDIDRSEIEARLLIAEQTAGLAPGGTLASQAWREAAGDVPALLAALDEAVEVIAARDRALSMLVVAMTNPDAGVPLVQCICPTNLIGYVPGCPKHDPHPQRAPLASPTTGAR